MRALITFLLLVAVSASNDIDISQRIVGGSTTTINNYPAIAAVLRASDRINFRQDCGGSILNQRSVLSAAHCFMNRNTALYRVRVGSTFGNSGGVTHNINNFIIHPNYVSIENDIAIVRTASSISYTNVVRPASLAGANYNVPDNDAVWAAGWGLTATGGQLSEVLRHVQLRTINQNVCRGLFMGSVITNNMLCAGALNVGGVGQCTGDSGGPLYHRGTVVGVCSFTGITCGAANSASVSVRVSRYISWIQSNA